MSHFRPHGARILCVAASEKDFPAPVREWLGKVGPRAHYSQDLYDALAVLATGTRPVVMVVSVEAVDWNEMEFFGHVATISRGTRVYVIAQEANDGRVLAAIERGAKLFDSALAQADLEAVFSEPLTGGAAGGLLAGSLRPSQISRTPINVSQPPAEPGRPAEVAESTTPASPPPIRLITSAEAEQGEDVAVSVPWTPHPSRPQRTPPKPATAERIELGEPAETAEPEKPLPRVDLTPEEIAALLGRPASDQPRAKEQRS